MAVLSVEVKASTRVPVEARTQSSSDRRGVVEEFPPSPPGEGFLFGEFAVGSTERTDRGKGRQSRLAAAEVRGWITSDFGKWRRRSGPTTKKILEY